MEFGRGAVDTIFAGQFGGRQAQRVGYRVLLHCRFCLHASKRARTSSIVRARLLLRIAILLTGLTGGKDDVTSYARRNSCGLTESLPLLVAANLREEHGKKSAPLYISPYINEPHLWLSCPWINHQTRDGSIGDFKFDRHLLGRNLGAISGGYVGVRERDPRGCHRQFRR